MELKQFIKSSEYENFKLFLKELEKMPMKYVSRFSMLRAVPNNYAGVYISEKDGIIHVFIKKAIVPIVIW